MSEEPVFFWNGPLSNWYPSEFKDEEGTVYCNNEQYMMRQKAILFKDEVNEEHIMRNTNPRHIKWYGRQVKNFDFSIWEKYARDIVSHGCYLKFSQNPKLKKYILSTKDRLLVEASPYDKLWGIGLSEAHARKTLRDKWLGKNWLGECLMRARKTIKEQSKQNP